MLDDLASGGDGAAYSDPAAGDDGGFDPGGPDFLPLDQWAGMVGGIIGMTGQVAGLETLATSPARPTFHPAMAELHAICCANPQLHWLVAPDNPTLKAVVVVGAWAVPVAVGCGQEIRAKRAKVVEPVEPEPEAPEPGPTAANDNAGEA